MKKSILMVALLLMMSLASACYALETTTTLYAHGEGIAIGATGYKALKTTACDGAEASIVLESASSGLVALGNSSAIQVSSLHSKIAALNAGTWTFKYYAVANVTEKTTLLCDILLVDSTGSTQATLGDDVAETALLTASNATKTATASISKTSVALTDYIKVVWYANKTDTTALKVTLWLDVAANPTEITDVGYTYATSAFWNSAVRTMWQILMPILFVIGVGIKFIGSEKRKPSVDEVIILAIAFFVVAILIPIALDQIYVA